MSGDKLCQHDLRPRHRRAQSDSGHGGTGHAGSSQWPTAEDLFIRPLYTVQALDTGLTGGGQCWSLSVHTQKGH